MHSKAVSILADSPPQPTAFYFIFPHKHPLQILSRGWKPLDECLKPPRTWGQNKGSNTVLLFQGFLMARKPTLFELYTNKPVLNNTVIFLVFFLLRTWRAKRLQKAAQVLQATSPGSLATENDEH